MSQASRLELRTGTGLVMTPQLRQAIRLLQLSGQELAAVVSQAIEENPFLDRPEGADSDDAWDRDPAPGLAEDSPQPADGLSDDGPEVSDGQDDGSALQDHGPWADAGGSGDPDEDLPDPASRISSEPSLREHLFDQIAGMQMRVEDRLIATALVDWLDEAGLFRDDPADAAAMLGVPVPRVIAVLNRMKACDPVGVFCQSLAECLEYQLAERDLLDGPMQMLLENLALVAEGKLADLAQRLGVTQKTLSQMLSVLRSLNPRPASAFGRVIAPARIADVLVNRMRDGTWRAQLNPAALPRIALNTGLVERVQAGLNPDDRAYAQRRLAEAGWFLRALEQRAKTTLQVAEEIIRRQAGFLTFGVMHLQPLTLKQVADHLSVHESTVSRVTTERWLQTPRGLFEMKYFFTTALNSSRHASVQYSAEAIRHRIKTLIEHESPEAVLSDDQIVEILTAEGVEIARRTVAKYREGLGLASSVRRRRRLKSGI